MPVDIAPEPSEAERQAILAALELERATVPAAAGAWSQAADLGREPFPEEGGGDAGVVEP